MVATTAKIAAYSSAATHGGVAAADPHRLIVMLLEGALERIAKARGCIERGELADKAQLLNRSVSIVGELRASLDLGAGGQIAQNLDGLYEYICNRLLQGNSDNDVRTLTEVTELLQQIRSAWISIPQEARKR